MSKPSCHVDPPCHGCGARHYDRGRFFPVYGLCVYCFDDPDAREAAAYRFRQLHPPPERPLPPTPCPYPPKSPERMATMQARLRSGHQLHHPDDATWDDFLDSEGPPAPTPEPKERTYQKRGSTGVEWSKGRARARPFWNGYKHNLGAFGRESEARVVVERFWREQLGLFAAFRDQARFWGYRPPVIVVRCKNGVRVPIFPYHLRRLALLAPGVDVIAVARRVRPLLSRLSTLPAVLARLAREARRECRVAVAPRKSRRAAWMGVGLFPDPPSPLPPRP
jgi:hypothetical protein